MKTKKTKTKNNNKTLQTRLIFKHDKQYTNKERERERERETETETETETDRQTDRQTDRYRETDRESYAFYTSPFTIDSLFHAGIPRIRICSRWEQSRITLFSST